MDQATIAANDYSLYCDVDLDDKMKPVHHLIELLLTRLEEFQILLQVIQRDQTNSTNILSLLSYRTEFNGLCEKIDQVETMMTHMKSNLEKLEEDIDKAEADLGFREASIKVTNLFTPLFKKSDKKVKANLQFNPVNTQDYFSSLQME